MTLGITKTYNPTNLSVVSSTGYNTDITSLFNAFIGLNNQSSSLGGLTITPTNNLTSPFSITNITPTIQFYIDTVNSKIVDTSTNGIESTYGIYHDRGDVSSWDFNNSGLILDLVWRDWDISSIVPIGTTAVLIYVEYTPNALGDFISFGKQSGLNCGRSVPQALGVAYKQNVIASPNSSRILKYAAYSTGALYKIVIKGWWK